MTPPHTWPLPASSSIARLQQLTGLSLLVWTVGLAVWGAESPDGTLAWALVPLLTPACWPCSFCWPMG